MLRHLPAALQAVADVRVLHRLAQKRDPRARLATRRSASRGSCGSTSARRRTMTAESLPIGALADLDAVIERQWTAHQALAQDGHAVPAACSIGRANRSRACRRPGRRRVRRAGCPGRHPARLPADDRAEPRTRGRVALGRDATHGAQDRERLPTLCDRQQRRSPRAQASSSHRDNFRDNRHHGRLPHYSKARA